MTHPSTCHILIRANLHFIILHLWISIVAVFFAHLTPSPNVSEPSWDTSLHGLFTVPCFLSLLITLESGATLTTLILVLSITTLGSTDMCYGLYQRIYRVSYDFTSATTLLLLLTVLFEHLDFQEFSVPVRDAFTFSVCFSVMVLLPFLFYTDCIFTCAMSAAEALGDPPGEDWDASNVHADDLEKAQFYHPQDRNPSLDDLSSEMLEESFNLF